MNSNKTQGKDATIKALPMPFKNTQDDKTVLMQIVDYYHQCIKQNPNALTYCQQRGISLEAIDYFKLGFSDRTLGNLLPTNNKTAGKKQRGQLQRMGILRNTGHELFRGSLVVPIINNNIVVEMYGRKITDKVRSGTPLHLYLSDKPQGVFNVEALEHNHEIILCGSLMDALTFWCAGYKNATCSYGTSGFSHEHLSYSKQYNIQRVLIAYRRNKDGNTAAQTLSDQLISEGMDCYRIEFPKNMDANEYALQVSPAEKSLGLVIRKAAWLGNGCDPQQPNIKPLHDDEPLGDVNTVGNSLDAANTLPPLDSVSDTDILGKKLKQDDTTKQSINKILPASPLPAPATQLDAVINDDEVNITLDNRCYRIRGFKKNLTIDQLKVNVRVSCDDDLHVDTFDLYAARPRATFIKQASIEIGLDTKVIKKDFSKILIKLEAIQDDNIEQTLSPQQDNIILSKAEHTEAMALLKTPDLLNRILDDFQRCGVVGESTNKLVGYIAAVSRKLDKPLAIIFQSSSAAGKSALMDAVLAFVPTEERVQYSAMTGQSLYYLGEKNIKHKILAISEEEGVNQAAYALKILQSEGQLTLASTGKDPDSGKYITHEYKVEGPVMIFSTTTAIDIDEELLNRCIVLSVDEDRAQTQAIHDLQRYEETLDGLLTRQAKNDILTVHQNAQRLLKPLAVVNPFAQHLTFLDDKTRTRRDHKKYLTLIRSITLLHQYQRTTKTAFYNGQSIEYIEVALDDIETANRLAHDVLGRSLDELPPQTKRLLILIEQMVNQQCQTSKLKQDAVRFSRKDIRHYSGWTDFQVKIHMKRLEEMEYVLVYRGRRGQSYEYTLLYNGEGHQGDAFMMRLIDIQELKQQYDAKK